MHTSATWRITLNRPCEVAVPPVVKLLCPLVIINNKPIIVVFNVKNLAGALYNVIGCLGTFLSEISPWKLD